MPNHDISETNVWLLFLFRFIYVSVSLSFTMFCFKYYESTTAVQLLMNRVNREQSNLVFHKIKIVFWFIVYALTLTNLICALSSGIRT